MPKPLNIEVVSISETPPLESISQVNGLEALLVEDGPQSAAYRSGPEETAIGFEVYGLPQGKKAWIRQKDGKCQLILEVRSSQAEWLGEYSSVQAALQALSGKLMPGLFL
jgi:hypothetical protein